MQRQEPEDRMPAGVHEQQAADHRRDRRRHAEVDRHLRHHPLRVGRREHVADDGARHHHAGAGATCPAARGRTPAGRCVCDSAQPTEASVNTATPHSTTGRRPKLSDSAPWNRFITRKAEQVGRQRLLHLHRRGAERLRRCRRRPAGRCRSRTARACPGRPAARPASSAGRARAVGVGVHRGGERAARRSLQRELLQCKVALMTMPAPRAGAPGGRMHHAHPPTPAVAAWRWPPRPPARPWPARRWPVRAALVAAMTDGPFYPPRAWREQWADWDADLSRVQRDGRTLRRARRAPGPGAAGGRHQRPRHRRRRGRDLAMRCARRLPPPAACAGPPGSSTRASRASAPAAADARRRAALSHHQAGALPRAHAAHPRQAAPCQLRRSDARSCSSPATPAMRATSCGARWTPPTGRCWRCSCSRPQPTAACAGRRGRRWCCRPEESVKQADRPDSVRRALLRAPRRDRHSSGPCIAARLGATYPPAPRATIIVCLFGVAARRDCPFHPERALPAPGGCSVRGLRRGRAACATRCAGLRRPLAEHPCGTRSDSSLLL